MTRAIIACLLIQQLSITLARAQCDQESTLLRPIQLGVSGGNINSFESFRHQRFCFGGTLGSLVQDSASQYILSNNHILARTGKARPGEPIVQPGLEDTSCMRNTGDAVASFSRAVKLSFKMRRPNTVDAAIAAVTSGDVDSQIRNIGSISNATVAASLGLSVQKMGRATCVTTGSITAVGVSAIVSYNDFNPRKKRALFVNQFVTSSSFSSAGDSGSLIVTNESCPRAVGLLFAGSSDGTTIANPISNVLSSLGVTMVGSCSAAAPDSAAEIAQNNGGAPVEAVTAATAVRDRHSSELMSIPGAVGTGIGIGDQPGHAAIEVYVKQITPEIKAAAPATLEGLPVRLVEVRGGFVAY